MENKHENSMNLQASTNPHLQPCILHTLYMPKKNQSKIDKCHQHVFMDVLWSWSQLVAGLESKSTNSKSQTLTISTIQVWYN